MRVLVTGGAGFLGSHLTTMLLSEAHEVTVLDNLSTGRQTNVPRNIRFLRGDITAPLTEVFRSLRPEVVVNLAAQVSVPASVDDPGFDLTVNVGGIVNLMEAAGHVDVRKVIHVSSAAVYGVPARLPLTEGSPANPISPYGLSKLTAEQYVRILGSLRGVTHTIIRPANMFGPRQRTKGEGAVIPAFVERFLAGVDPIIHGDGSQVRDFIYVTDVARAICCALERADGRTINVSTGIGISVADVWRSLASLVGWTQPPIFGQNRVGDISESIMSNELAKRELNWVPSVGFVAGLAETIGWFSNQEAAAPD